MGKEIIYLVALHSIGFTHKKLHKIFEKEENYKEVFDKISKSFLEEVGFNDKQIDSIQKAKAKLDFKQIEKKLSDRQVQVITIKDFSYPENLKNIFNPPYLFYLRGNLEKTNYFAIVGSRKITNYGEKVIKDLVPEISKYFTIVSGGATGCDSIAHIETLKSKQKTLAVIGTGIDLDYPVSNKKLYDEIVSSNGAIISIFPLGELRNPYNFPIRNEIIAGLSSGVLIVEAQEKSGSLITAKLALDLGKDLFAVPGDIYRINSAGCNNLIKNAEAKLVTKRKDILEEYNISFSQNKKRDLVFETELDKKIYDNLLLEPLNIDEIGEKLQEDIQIVSFRISMMELEGFIKKGLDGRYLVS